MKILTIIKWKINNLIVRLIDHSFKNYFDQMTKEEFAEFYEMRSKMIADRKRNRKNRW